MSKRDDILKKNGSNKQSIENVNETESTTNPKAESFSDSEDKNIQDSPLLDSETVEKHKAQLKLKLDSYASKHCIRISDDKIQANSAIWGIILGIVFSAAIAATTSRQTMLGMLFNFESKQIVLPIVMFCMFCWGIVLSMLRRSRIRKIEKISNSEVIADLSYSLTLYTPIELHDLLDEMEISQICPLLKRLRVVLRQWSSKPSLQDSMSLIEQISVSDSEDIRHTYGIIKTFIWSLPVLGLIGTVIGIALAVGDFGQLLGGNVDDVSVIKTSLIRVTAGLSYAFTTTLLGLLGALFLTLISYIMQTREEKLNKRSESTIVDHFLPLIQGMYPEQSGSGMLSNSSDLRESLKEIVSSTVQSAGIAANEVLLAARMRFDEWQDQIMVKNQHAIVQISEASEKIGDRLSKTTTEFLTQLTQIRISLENTVEAIRINSEKSTSTSFGIAEKLDTAMEKHIKAAHETILVIQQLQTSYELLRGGHESLAKSIAELTHGEIIDVLKSLAETIQAIKVQNEANSQIMQSTTTINERLTSCQMNLENSIKQIEDMGLTSALQNLGETLKFVSEVLKHFHEPIVFQAVPASSLK